MIRNFGTLNLKGEKPDQKINWTCRVPAICVILTSVLFKHFRCVEDFIFAFQSDKL